MFSYPEAMTKLEALPDVLTLSEVAELFDVPKKRVETWIDGGLVKPCPASSLRLVRFLKSNVKKDLLRYQNLEF